MALRSTKNVSTAYSTLPNTSLLHHGSYRKPLNFVFLREVNSILPFYDMHCRSSSPAAQWQRKSHIKLSFYPPNYMDHQRNWQTCQPPHAPSWISRRQWIQGQNVQQNGSGTESKVSQSESAKDGQVLLCEVEKCMYFWHPGWHSQRLTWFQPKLKSEYNVIISK